jgi:hypothetical protein
VYLNGQAVVKRDFVNPELSDHCLAVSALAGREQNQVYLALIGRV